MAPPLSDANATFPLLTRLSNPSALSFHGFADSIQEYALFLINPQGRITTWNRGAVQIFGFQVKEIIGQSIDVLYSLEDQLNQKPSSDLKIALTEKQFEEEGLRSRKEGTPFWVLFTLTPLYDQGSHVGYSVIIRDIDQRKREELEQQQTNQLLRAIVNETTDAVFVKDCLGRYLLFNPSASRFVGLPIKEVLGKDDTELFDAQSARFVMDRDRQVMEAGEVETKEEELTAAGTTRTYLATKAPFWDASGNLLGLIGISRDITDRKQMEEAIRESEERFRRLIEISGEMVWTTDAMGTPREDSPSWRAFTGYSVNQWLNNRDLLEAFHPEDRQRLGLGWRAALESRTHFETEVRLLHHSGEYRHILCRAVPLLNADGTVRMWVGINTDITERKRAEEAVRRSEEMLRLVIDAIPQGVFWKDRNSRFLGCNKLIAQVIGLDHPNQITGRTHAEIQCISEEETAFFLRKDREVMESNTPQSHIVESMTLADGRTIWLDTNKIPLHDPDGRVVGILGTWEDITERKRAEEVLRRNEAVLVQAGQMAHLGAWDIEFQSLENRDGNPLRWSDEVFRIFGYQPGEVPPTNDLFFHHVHPDDRELIRTALAEAIAQKQPYQIEHRIIRKDHSEGIVLEKAEITFDDRGNPIRIIGAVQDITERKQAEKALHQAHLELTRSEKEFRSLADNALVGIFRTTLSGNLLYANDAIAKLFGFASSSEVMNQHVPSLYQDPQDRSTMLDILKQSRNITNYEVTMRTRFGEPRTVLLSATLDESIVSGMLIDITDRKKSEDALRLFRTLIDHSNDGIEVVDPETGRFLDVNERSCIDSGYSREELLSLRVQDIDPTVPEDHFERQAKQIRSSEYMIWEGIHRRKDGSTFPVEVNIRWVRLDREYLLAVVRDTTQRKEAERKLSESETRFAQVAATIPGVVHSFCIRPDGSNYFPYASAGIKDIFGLTPEELLNDSSRIISLIHPDDKDRVGKAIQESAQNLTAFHNEHRIFHPTKGERWIEIRSAPTRELDGGTLWHGIITDISERKRTEEALAQSEHRYRTLVDQATDGIYLHDGEGKLIDVNRSACEGLGYSREELLQLIVTDLDQNFTLDALIEIWGQMQPDHSHTVYGRHRRKDGTQFPVEVRIGCFEFEGKKLFLALVRDITQRKEAEQQLAESEERYRRLVHVLPDAVFINCENQIVYSNQAFLRLLGATDLNQVIGRSPFDIFHPDFHDALRARIRRMHIRWESSPPIEEMILRLDGKSVTVLVVATPILDRGIPSTLVVLHDLTEQRRSGESLRSLLQSVIDSIITINEHGIIQSVNPGTEKLFSYSSTELIGQNVKMLMPDPFRSEHDRYLENGAPTGMPKIIGAGREVEGLRKDGTKFPAEISITEFWLDNERHFTGVLRDITERKKLEEQLRQSQKMEAVGRLAGGVAHDFNNLLTVISGFSDLLLMELSINDPKRPPITAIREAGERAAGLTRQLLAFSRKQMLAPVVLDLNEVVNNSDKLLRRLIGEDILLISILDPRLRSIKVDINQIEQVIMNLVVNSRDAMPNGGRITIETKNCEIEAQEVGKYLDLKPGPYVQLSVSDTGHGMTEEVKAKIFEPFFTTKDQGKGTGLGLAVVHGVIKQSDGHISVYSEVGIGTSFKILFPGIKDAKVRVKDSATPIAPRGTETILLVEDEEAVRRIARITLETQGYHVLEAGKGTEAIAVAMYHPEPIHLLLTDVVMPEMGGRQLVDRLRPQHPEMKVLFMSGYTDDAVIRHGIIEGTDSFLEKPFSLFRLSKKVRQVLDE